MNELHEASMNFDLDGLGPFLTRIRARIPGLAGLDVAAITRTAAAMNVDEEREWSFQVEHGGAHVSLKIRVFMDDINAPDLYIFTSEDLAKQIQREMHDFAEEHGQ